MRDLRQYRVVVLTGTGKSGLVAQLGASILQSVGVNAHYVHSTDMMHGSMAVFSMNEGPKLLIGITHSGKTRETLEAMKEAETHGADVVAISGHDITASNIDEVILYHVERDGSKHGTIPVYSSMEQLRVIGSMACHIADDMTAFELYTGHPGGALSDAYRKEM